MPNISISNAKAQGLDGVSFVATAGGVEQQFLVAREGREDLEDSMFDTAEAMLEAFHRQLEQISLVAAKALHEGPAGRPTIVLQSLLS
jgi:hypothetical protein